MGVNLCVFVACCFSCRVKHLGVGLIRTNAKALFFFAYIRTPELKMRIRDGARARDLKLLLQNEWGAVFGGLSWEEF